MSQGRSPLRIAVLDASHRDPNTRRNFRRELDADLAEFDAAGGELPTHYEFDGVVVTGSRSSVYWDEEWIESLVSYVEGAHAAGLPILGVCYGHQLLATALGGRVEDMGEYELGYREVRHSGDDDLFEGIDEAFTVFTTHSDAVVELPPGAELVAENDYGVHGFREGHAWGVQFHPEYDPETAESVVRGKDLPEERIESVVAGIDAENYEAACEAKRLFDNFVAYAERVRDGADDADADADEPEATV